MGIESYEDSVIIKEGKQFGDPTIVTVNCPDKTGLGCDICRIILQFGLSITKGDVTTDGKWCYLVFWVLPKPAEREISWRNMQERMISACPMYSPADCLYSRVILPAKPSEVYMLKLSSLDRRGLLHDVTQALYELELTLNKVKVSTTPEGKVMDLFFITDNRELLHTKGRQEETHEKMRMGLGESLISCVLELVGPEMVNSQQTSSSSSSASLLTSFMPETFIRNHKAFTEVSVTMDNLLSPSHTLIQIACFDHKGLLYDVLRTLKDYNIQVSYARFAPKERGHCEVDLLVMQADGKKLVDSDKQMALSNRLRTELQPLPVRVVTRGPDMELLVANPVEVSGMGRPLVFYDITLALKNINICIFSAEIGRHTIGDRDWEVYRILLDDVPDHCGMRNKIESDVRKMLMGQD